MTLTDNDRGTIKLVFKYWFLSTDITEMPKNVLPNANIYDYAANDLRMYGSWK